jgi:hypothetical protein
MYTSSILMLLSWPVLILISWWVTKAVLTRYEKKHAGTNSSKD